MMDLDRIKFQHNLYEHDTVGQVLAALVRNFGMAGILAELSKIASEVSEQVIRHCQYCGDGQHVRIDSAWRCVNCGEIYSGPDGRKDE